MQVKHDSTGFAGKAKKDLEDLRLCVVLHRRQNVPTQLVAASTTQESVSCTGFHRKVDADTNCS